MCNRLGASCDLSSDYQLLMNAYSEPHRAYHTLEHLNDCLGKLDAARHHADRPIEIEAALWFHDAVYDAHASDNEIQSASWAQKALGELGVLNETTQYVADLILATRHITVPFDHNAALLLDIDLSILGAEPEAFDIYEQRIRREYSWVPERDFCHARAPILEAFLSRPKLYQTAFFQDRYEEQARINLHRSIAQLRFGAGPVT
jgi:predicted metal-dependent HD superfamily phosphohydrolase